MAKKKSKNTKRKPKAPEFTRKILIGKSECQDLLNFYNDFEIPVDPVLKSTCDKIIGGGVMTLEDQKVIAKSLMADIAKRTFSAFADSLFDDIAAECSRVLTKLNPFKKKRKK